MILVELMEQVELPVPTNCFFYPCRDRVTTFQELSIIKPMDKLADFGDDWDNIVILGRFEKLAKRLEDEFLVNCRCT